MSEEANPKNDAEIIDLVVYGILAFIFFLVSAEQAFDRNGTWTRSGIALLLALLCIVIGRNWRRWIMRINPRLLDSLHLSRKEAISSAESTETVDLRTLSNDDLRHKSIIHADAMRRLEAKYYAAGHPRIYIQYSTPEERDRQHNNEQIARDRAREDCRTEYTITYRPKAVAYCNEMLRREDKPPITNWWATGVDYSNVPHALTDGMLSGVSPILEAADFLENMARKLP